MIGAAGENWDAEEFDWTVDNNTEKIHFLSLLFLEEGELEEVRQEKEVTCQS